MQCTVRKNCSRKLKFAHKVKAQSMIIERHLNNIFRLKIGFLYLVTPGNHQRCNSMIVKGSIQL